MPLPVAKLLFTGEMVDGPRGFLLYRGPTPGYSALIKAFGSVVKLRVRRALRRSQRPWFLLLEGGTR